MPEPLTNVASLVAQMPHAVWTASQMASYRAPVLQTGFPRLDIELPNGGWPKSALIELLIQQHGIGEMQLLKPALASTSSRRRIALIQPPFQPNGIACFGWGLQAEHLLWIKAASTSDALWSAEQILSHGSCGALLLWQTNIRPDALRRLHLAAQSSDTCMWMLRPIAVQQDSSPSPLRLGLRPAYAGIQIEIIKRRGPHSDTLIYLPLSGMPSTRHLPEQDHALLDQRMPAATPARSASTLLV